MKQRTIDGMLAAYRQWYASLDSSKEANNLADWVFLALTEHGYTGQEITGEDLDA